jgi:F5/8 type C domain.
MIDGSTIILTAISVMAAFIILSLVLYPMIQQLRCKIASQKEVAKDTPPAPPDVKCQCADECFTGCDGSMRLRLLSRGKPVKIVPDWQSYPGSNLTDGDYNTFAHSADWLSTTGVSAEIDLGKAYTIMKVKIFNRKDCCQDRFGPHQLFIDGKKVSEGDAKGAWEYEYCISVTGQKVKIQMDGVLNLSEIEVWGY